MLHWCCHKKLHFCVRHMNIKIHHLKKHSYCKLIMRSPKFHAHIANCLPDITISVSYRQYQLDITPDWSIIFFTQPTTSSCFSHLKKQYQHLPCCKEIWIRRKLTKIRQCYYLGGSILGVYFIPFKHLYYKHDTWLFPYYLKNKKWK